MLPHLRVKFTGSEGLVWATEAGKVTTDVAKQPKERLGWRLDQEVLLWDDGEDLVAFQHLAWRKRQENQQRATPVR
jgi:hypothetical protein